MRKGVVGVVEVLAALIVISTGVYVVRHNTPSGVGTVKVGDKIPLEKWPRLGSDDAPVTMLIFSDFQCPFCAKFTQQVWPAIKLDYIDKGVLRAAFVHRPLAIHSRAKWAAIAAACAGLQGNFWPMHDLLFVGLPSDEQALERDAVGFGVEPHQFNECRAGEGVERVERDIQIAERLGIDSTPFFAFGRSNQPVAMFADVTMSGTGAVLLFKKTIDSLIDRYKGDRK